MLCPRSEMAPVRTVGRVVVLTARRRAVETGVSSAREAVDPGGTPRIAGPGGRVRTVGRLVRVPIAVRCGTGRTGPSASRSRRFPRILRPVILPRFFDPNS